MINLKFDITTKDEDISPSVNGKVFNLVRMFNAHLERLQDAGMFQWIDIGNKRFVIFVPDWLEASSQTCFAWAGDDFNDVKGFLETLAKFPQVFCKVVYVLTTL